MAKVTQVVESEEVKAPEVQDYPAFKGDAKAEYLDINNPKFANKTYEELQG